MTDTDRIESDVLVHAPVERVWALVTQAEYLGRWFGDAGADVDLRPGGTLTLRWHGDATVVGRIEAVEPPSRFVWRWLHDADAEQDATPANSTRVEFTLAAEPEGTRVTVVETGFDGLDVDADARARLLASHTEGWPQELGELVADGGRVAR